MGFYFVALILNNVMVQKESKKTDSRFKRKMCFKLANQLNQPCRDTCHSNFEAVR